MDLETNEGIPESEQDEPGNGAESVARDLLKQLITLAAGVLALSATFIEKIAPLPTPLLIVLAGSWLALITSVFCGLQTMSIMVKSKINSDDEWSKGRGRRYAQISKYGFVVGIALFAAFAMLLLSSQVSKRYSPPELPSNFSHYD